MRPATLLRKLTTNADALAAAEKVVARLKEEQRKLWTLGDDGGVRTEEMAAASRVKPVTIRQARKRTGRTRAAEQQQQEP